MLIAGIVMIVLPSMLSFFIELKMHGFKTACQAFGFIVGIVVYVALAVFLIGKGLN